MGSASRHVEIPSFLYWGPVRYAAFFSSSCNYSLVCFWNDAGIFASSKRFVMASNFGAYGEQHSRFVSDLSVAGGPNSQPADCLLMFGFNSCWKSWANEIDVPNDFDSSRSLRKSKMQIGENDQKPVWG